MSFLPIAMLALSAIGAAKSFKDSSTAASNLRIAGEKNAQLSEHENAERVRRFEYGHTQEQGQRLVAAAKSGVRLSSGSTMAVMAEAANVAGREISFMKEQSKRTAAAQRQGVATQASTLETNRNTLAITNVEKIVNSPFWDT